VGCWSAAEKESPVNVPNETVKNTKEVENDTAEEIAEQIKEETESNDKKSGAPPLDKELSPTEALREFDAATNAKSVERIKRVITKSSIEFFESEAKKQGFTFKQLVERPSEMPTVETPEMRNEKIDGNRATVEAKNRFLGSYDTYPLVKEDGVWKVEYDKYLKQQLEKLNMGPVPVPKEK